MALTVGAPQAPRRAAAGPQAAEVALTKRLPQYLAPSRADTKMKNRILAIATGFLEGIHPQIVRAKSEIRTNKLAHFCSGIATIRKTHQFY